MRILVHINYRDGQDLYYRTETVEAESKDAAIMAVWKMVKAKHPDAVPEGAYAIISRWRKK